MRLNFAETKAFQGKALPTETQLVGLSALVQILSLAAPVRRPSAVSEKHIRGSHRDEDDWRLFDKRYWPGDNFADHLTFALRHEDLDLLVLKRVFKAVPKAEIRDFVTAAPTGVPARRVWFLYEMLTGETLDIPDTPNVAAVDLFDPKAYFTGKPKLSKRHRVRNNLLGTKDFSPVIRRTSALVALTESGLAEKARETVGRNGGHVVSRAASFLLLADSRASFEIEGERPPRNRLERWGRAVVQAGKHALTLEEIVRLHSVLIEDTRLIHPGLRPDGVFLGERDHENNPLPEFIGARPDDLTSLMKGLIDANARMRDDGIDAVLQAASTAFGFVYVHPLQDGNGRLHRCLIHHVLAERKFTPPGMVFPVSSVMLDRIDDYRTTLQSHSGPLMEFIDWKPTSDRNVEVLNDTADLYCYFDCTDEAEFLYRCVKRTVEHDLPHEIDYLRRHDEARRKIMDTVEMPDRLADDLLLFIRQNKGVLSKKRREREFEKLTDDEVASIEAVVRDAFEGFEDSSNEQNHAP
ncbi:Fic family protein [Bradyrhizobium valentinum]|uniref:Fic family protein n=1 Tax=Bradyrhizobium valentinum TaxID=1518501 RepID=UPI00070BA1DB|nr:Fic family protein [Bradyrhizobium valentinum]KRR12467.1 cell filamentation protein Fic [Bradyrhizobium valentinum]